jgi:hypothetical protein
VEGGVVARKQCRYWVGSALASPSHPISRKPPTTLASARRLMLPPTG